MKNNHYKNIGVVLLVLFTLSYLFSNKYLFWATFALGVLLFSFEKLAILFSRYWMKLGKLLGDFNAKILLSVFYFVILIPTALIKKLTTKKNTNSENSNWINIEHEEVDFTKPW